MFSGHLALLVNHVIQKGTYVIAMYIGISKNMFFSGHLALFYVTYVRHNLAFANLAFLKIFRLAFANFSVFLNFVTKPSLTTHRSPSHASAVHGAAPLAAPVEVCSRGVATPQLVVAA